MGLEFVPYAGIYILGWVILLEVGQWISSCHFYYQTLNSEQLLFYWCIWKKLIYLHKFGLEDFVYPYIKSNFEILNFGGYYISRDVYWNSKTYGERFSSIWLTVF